MPDDTDVKTVLAKVTELLEKEAEAVAKLDARLKKLEQNPSYLGVAVQNSPILAILLGLAQAVLTNVDVMGVPGVGGTPTANITASSVIAMFLAGFVNWMKPKEPAK